VYLLLYYFAGKCFAWRGKCISAFQTTATPAFIY